jgi:hypothetical protein
VVLAARLFRFGSFRETSERDPYHGFAVFFIVFEVAIGVLCCWWGHFLVNKMMDKA